MAKQWVVHGPKGKESIDQFETHLYRDSDGKIRVKGKKYYTTGVYMQTGWMLG